MLSQGDRRLVERDAELPGLAVVLDADAVIDSLRHLAPEADVRGARACYVRYKPATSCLAVEGTLGCVVAPAGEWVPDTGFLLAGGRRLQGIIGGSANPHLLIPQLVEYWRAGRFPFDRMIEEFEFSDFAHAWTETGSGRVIKAVLRMPET